MKLSNLDIFRRMGMTFRTDREEGRLHASHPEDQEVTLPQNPISIEGTPVSIHINNPQNKAEIPSGESKK